MNKKIVILAVIIVIIVLAVMVILNKTGKAPETNNVVNNVQNNNNIAAPAVKEFSMTSYYDETGIWFSLKEISVNKGDVVRVKVTNIKGTHDFALDEYSIKEMTPLNQEVIIEFTADKVGEFIYYCSVSGHRQKGQWGTLKVLDK